MSVEDRVAELEKLVAELKQDAEKFLKIVEVLAGVDEHRSRSVKDAFAAIKAIVHPEAAASITAAQTPEPVPEDDHPGDLPAPPKHGKGSSVDAWREHAEALGFDVSQDASREEIIAAVEAGGVGE